MACLHSIADQLVCYGLLAAPVRIKPLTGGVSSDIALISDSQRQLVVKRALDKLKVKDDWHANVERNRTERAYLQAVARHLPQRVPEILADGKDASDSPWFAMTYIPPPMIAWKSLMLAGTARLCHARAAGATLGTVHRLTWGNPAAAARFDTTSAFHDLRLEPYLLTTAERHRDLASRIRAEVERLAATRRCLVHGDFSPKNLLVHPAEPENAPTDQTRLIVLDCEVAWYGDPAFDVAFLLNHLLLKSLHLPTSRDQILPMIEACWVSYVEPLGEERSAALSPQVARLLPMLLLARVDGKSPAEYLTEPERCQARSWARAHIATPPNTVPELAEQWEKDLG